MHRRAPTLHPPGNWRLTRPALPRRPPPPADLSPALAVEFVCAGFAKSPSSDTSDIEVRNGSDAGGPASILLDAPRSDPVDKLLLLKSRHSRSAR